MKERLRVQNGTAVVEFALVLFPLVVLIFGMVEFGFFLYNQQVITNASREGARAGIVAQDPRVPDGQIASIVNIYCQQYLVTFGARNDPVTSVTRGDTPNPPLTVTVTYSYGFLAIPKLINLIPGIITDPYPMTAVTTMRCE
jgi:Flp pilus assembly protein TadG